VSSNSLFIKEIIIYFILKQWSTKYRWLALNSTLICILSAFLSSPSFASPNSPDLESERYFNSHSEIRKIPAKRFDNKSQPISKTTSQSHNKAGNGLYSVNQYDKMLRRIVRENTRNKTAGKNSSDIWSDIRNGFQLKGYDKARVDSELEWYAKSQGFVDRVTTRATPYIYFVLDEVKQRDMPTEIALLPIVESAYLPFAFSSSQAAGLWQFIAETGQHYGLELNW